MAKSSVRGEDLEIPATEGDPGVGGGDHGAPLVDAARPKPSGEGTEALLAANPDARAVVGANMRILSDSPKAQEAVLIFAEGATGGDMKRGRVEENVQMDAEIRDQQTQMEATGHGAAGNLTGTRVAPR